ncbi:Eco57I restriction-modification methylase domain-containing protein [Ornithinimicrobium cavernae]|uniref:Eco57I restriction-modification methylase domain-containing protein n=1 Tax=Ornithinimicrobium cavernae TaxID=2666047 RepID=UPI000D69CC2C|nr:DNA methyltransferase [Ornithinimicrobium cavernae]
MSDFTTIRAVGGLIPPDLLSRIVSGDKQLTGLSPSDYHLSSESPREAANRAWSYLTGVWATFRSGLEKLQEGDPAVGLTREKWLLQLLRELDYGRVPTTPVGGLQIGDRAFPVSHLWGSTPLHLLGWGVELDKRTKGVAGAAERAPHAMVQEALNRTDDYLFAVVSNGRVLRLLRDSTSLSGQSYVEFDLEAMFDGEVFSDFVLLYLLLHQSRVEVRSAEGAASDCWLEAWRTTSIASGTRALSLLRDGVRAAIEALGTGFLQHPANAELRRRLDDKEARLEDLHHALLRLVYRLLFLFVAEDRGALLDLSADPAARQRYADYFSTARLRRLALRRRGTKHTDLWAALTLVITALGDEHGQPALGLPGIGGLYDQHEADALLMDAGLPNDALLTAVQSLSVVQPKGQPKQSVDYRNLGAEELGSIYESLLELVPRYNTIEQTLALEALAGNDRKTTGSYYTPSSLIDLVLDEALDPLLDEAERAPDPETALLAMTVCDPACGSGHFLVAAARRIAERLATVRTGDADLTPTDVRDALHEVVGTCIYGVDLNPLAAELAKVSLWLAAMTPGRPLSFLDAHIKVGNALLGTTPALVAEGIPDDAFVALTGDDKRVATALKKQNKLEREAGQESLLDIAEAVPSNADLRAELADVRLSAPKSLADVHEAKRRYAAYLDSPDLALEKLRADAWCAAFVQPKTAAEALVTTSTLRAMEDGTLVADATTRAVRDRSAEYRFFHWWLEFPEVFEVSPATAGRPSGWRGGFTALVGNPPWERIALDDGEFFSSRAPEVLAPGTTAERKRRIQDLEMQNPVVHADFLIAKRRTEATARLLAGSGMYEYGTQGRLTTQGPFAELFLMLTNEQGMASLIVPTGVVADVPMRAFWRHLVGTRAISCVFDFENSNGIFPSIHRSTKFSIIALRGDGRAATRNGETLRVATYIRTESQLMALKLNQLRYSHTDLEAISPKSLQIPLCQTQRDVNVLTRMVNSRTADSLTPRAWVGFTSEAQSGNYLMNGGSGRVPLLEGKLMHQFDPHFATYKGVSREMRESGKPRLVEAPDRSSAAADSTRYWVETSSAASFLRRKQSDPRWTVVVRDYARATDERTAICAIAPTTVPIQPLNGVTAGGAGASTFAVCVINSFAYDFIVRQRVPGQHFNVTTMNEIPLPPAGNDEEFVVLRGFELTYTHSGLSGYADQIVDFYPKVKAGPPFRWIPQRREILRAELDAAIFRLYGLARDEVEHVMESFTVVRKYDERDHGEFRTKRLILEIFDAMAKAARDESGYESPLNPPPGEGPRHSG